MLTERQRNLLAGRMWWVADQNRPYLVKFALDANDTLMRSQMDMQKSLT